MKRWHIIVLDEDDGILHEHKTFIPRRAAYMMTLACNEVLWGIGGAYRVTATWGKKTLLMDYRQPDFDELTMAQWN